jgi:2-C-methyl-D-erythritol 4-phosphate cytidylyltransferase
MTSIYAIIPAGGVGRRMNNRKPKQFLMLKDKPILFRTITNLNNSKLISKFIIPSVDKVMTRKLLDKPELSDTDVHIIKSGKTRQQSILNGLELIIKGELEKPDFILIHDAVRALVESYTIKEVIEAAQKHGAAIAATPIFDSLKLSYPENAKGETLIKKTVSREHMWQAQTPQVFKTDEIIDAYLKAKADHYEGTDSASLFERLGKEVSLVSSPRTNIKITTPYDLELAEVLFDHRDEWSKD